MSPRESLYLIFNSDEISHRAKLKIIESLDDIHGFDLPFILSLLVETNSSGHLNIVVSSKKISGVSFAQGSIVAVDSTDEDTFLGRLLVEGGYLDPDDLERALHSHLSGRIGQKLIQMSFISPHALDLVMEEQINIRLSRVILDAPLKINFSPQEIEKKSVSVDKTKFLRYLHDWILSQVTKSWLRAHYMQWGSAQIKLRRHHDQNGISRADIEKFPLIKSLPGFFDRVTNGETLNQVIDAQLYPEEFLLKAIHFLCCQGILVFDNKVAVESESENQMRKIFSQIQNFSPLEMLGFMQNWTGIQNFSDVKFLSEFTRKLGDVPENEELKHVYDEILSIASQTLLFFQSPQNRERYLKQKEKFQSEEIFRHEIELQKARVQLERGQYHDAEGVLRILVQEELRVRYLDLYWAWANAGTKNLKMADEALMKVPVEEKHEPLFHFVSAFILNEKGNRENALISNETALRLDPEFLLAKELKLKLTK